MLNEYCNQTAAWQIKTGTNNYNQASYAAPVSIKCRKEQKIRQVRNKDGVEVVSNTTVFTPQVISVDDLIDGGVVIAISNMTDLAGKTIGYEVML